jgi:uncharacterized small protein (DUF1192 family)
MKRVTLREYSKRHKLSYFNVMKMVKNGDVKSEIIRENGKDTPYVLIDEAQEKKVTKVILETSAETTMSLKEKNLFLQKEIKRLEAELKKCLNKSTS